MNWMYTLEKLNEAKQTEYRRAAEVHRRAHLARPERPGLRYRLAQGLVVLATRLSPNHPELWRAVNRGKERPGAIANAPPR